MGDKRIPLSEVKVGESGKVVEFLGGKDLQNRLRALGIRPGVKIVKVSSTFARGPVVVKVARAQTALGFGVSCKVIVEVER